MAQPAWIELQCGPSRAFTVGIWLIWLPAAVASFSAWQHFSWPWLLAAGLVLIVCRPGSGSALRKRLRASFHADGSARLGDLSGAWRPSWHANRLGMLFTVSGAGGKHRVLVCAALNHPQDYRRLLVWSRYPPYGTGTHLSVSE